MFNVLKSALIYMLTYIAIFTGAFWITIFLLATLQIFWKFFTVVFFFIFAVMTFDYYKARRTVGTLESVAQVRSVMARVKAKYNIA